MASPERSFREKLIGRGEPIDRFRAFAFIAIVVLAAVILVLGAVNLSGLVKIPVIFPIVIGYGNLALAGFTLFLSFRIQDRNYGPLTEESTADLEDRT